MARDDSDRPDLASDPPLSSRGEPPPGDLPPPGMPEASLADLVEPTPRTPGRVNAAEAVTGDRPAGEGAGQAPPGGIPGDDASLDGGDPVR